MVKWIFFLSECVVISLVYLLSRLDAKPQQNRLFGITLPEFALAHPSTLIIKKVYLNRLNLIIGFILVGAIGQVALTFSLVSYALSYFFIILGLTIGLSTMNFIKSNESIKQLKVSEGWEAGAYIRGVHEDDFWIRGIFYYNAHDSARQVKKRMGIGLTPNLAYANARWLYFALMSGSFALIIFICSSMYYLEIKTPEFGIETDYLTVSYPVYYYKVPLKDIHQVKILKDTPVLSKQNGLETDIFARGYFYMEGRGSTYVCVYKHSPCLLLETKQGLILLNDDTAQGTYDLLEAIDLAHPEFEMNYQREDIKR